MITYDLCVIGSGPAGEKAAAHAAYFGRKVALIERSSQLGGAVVSNAGIPTKTLRETALYVSGFRRREIYGVSIDLLPDSILALLRRRTSHVVAELAAQVRRNMELHGVEIVRGSASVVGPRTVAVDDGSYTRSLEAEAILVATGSSPAHPAWIPRDDPDIHDTETILNVDRPFASIVVVGAGAVGCEYASVFAALGVDVTLVDEAPRILTLADPDVSETLADCFQQDGRRLLTGHRTRFIGRDGEGLSVVLDDWEALRPDKVLTSVGRVANTASLGLDAIGVAMSKRGEILVDDEFRSNVDTLFAAGDVIGPPGLASAAMEQGRLAASLHDSLGH